MGQRSVIAWVTAVFLIAAFSLAGAAALSPEAQKALTWLTGQVRSDGSLVSESSAIGVAAQSRSEAAFTLALLSAPSASLANAIAADTQDDTEFLARRIFALAGSGNNVAALLAALKSRQNSDGGFAAQSLADTSVAGGSSVLDSAWSLLALTAANAGGDAAAVAGRDYLLGAMEVDGGMPGLSDSDRIQASALSLLAFAALPPSTALAEKMTALSGWLVANQRPDGSWLGDEYLSALALSAVLPVTDVAAVRTNARRFLSGLQGQDGSWQGDPFLTAVVLRALAQDGAVPNGPATKVTGKVVDAKGGALLAGATVTLTPEGGTPLTTLSEADGTFSFASGLSAGNYSLSASKSGYAAALSGGFVVTAGQTRDAGTFALAQLATSGIVKGTVSAGSDAAPLAGVAVTLKVTGYGSANTITLNATTDAAGNYEFAGIKLNDPSITVFGANVTFSLSGYQSVSATAKIVVGSVSILSPQLYASGSTTPTLVTVSGRVVGPSGSPLAGVTISSTDNSALSGKTAIDGSFSFSFAPTIFSSITFSLPGYQSITQQFTPPAGANVDFGTIVLNNLTTTTTIAGKVRNQANNIALSGATVRVNGSLTATTDASGAFSFANLSGKVFDLAITAANYIDQYWHLEITDPASIVRDFLLMPLNTNSLNLSGVTVSPGSAGLNADVSVSATVSNPQANPVKGVAVLQLVNSQGTVIDTGSAFDAGGVNPLGVFTLGAGQSMPIRLKWNSGRFPPGAYTAAVRIVASQTMSKDLPSGVGLAMANSGLTIVRGSELSATVAASPNVIRSGFDIPVALSATLQNSGNVPLPNQSYRLSLIDGADGHVAATRTAKAQTVAVGDIVKLDFGSWVPNAKGNFKFSIVGDDGSSGTVAGALDVGAPAQATFALEKTVAPSGTQSVAANIRLNDVRSLTGYVEDPLKPLLKQAVQRAVRYNDSLTANWTHNNQCFGCHVQAQTLVGGDFANKFAPSYDKAQREKIYRGIVDYRLPTGTFGVQNGLSDNSYSVTSAVFGAWALTESSHLATQESVDAVFGALRYLKGIQETDGRFSDKDPFTYSDTNIGWMDKKSNTSMALRSLSLLKKFLNRHPDTYTQSVPASWVNLTAGAANSQLRVDANGNVLVATSNGTIQKVAPDGSHSVLASSLSGRMELGPDGSLYYLGAGQKLTRQSPGGALTTINAPLHYASGMAVGADGNVYFGAQVNSTYFNAIRRVTPSGQISDYVVNEPLLSAANSYMAFGPGGELVVTTGASNSKLLRVWTDKRSEIVLDFTGVASVIDIQWQQNAWWVTTNFGVYRYDKDWKGGFLPNFYYRNAVSGGGVLGGLSGFAPLANGSYVVANNTPILYRADPLSAESQLSQFDTMENKAVDWLLNNSEIRNGGNNFYAALFMLALSDAVEDISDPARKTKMQAEIGNIGAFLKSAQMPSGGWGWSATLPVDPMTTAVAGYALDTLNPNPGAPYIRKAVDFLLSTQQPDGSWLSPSIASQYPGRDNLTAQAPTSWVNIWLPRVLERVSNVNTSLTLDLAADVVLKNPRIAADTVQTGNSFGGVSHTWKFTGDSENLPLDLGFDLELQNMQAGETRAVAGAGNLTLSDSLSGLSASLPIAVPSVSSPSGVAVAAATDQSSYPGQADVVVTATVSNQNMAARNAVVKFEVVDAVGVTVASLPTASVALPANGSANVSVVFNTGATLAGGYAVRVSATSAGGAPLATGMGTFSIVPGAAKSSVKVSSDKAAYLSNDTVNLVTRVGNISGNDILTDLGVTTTLSAPDGALVFSKTDVLAQLLPGGFKDYGYAVNLNNAALGQYKAAVTVKAGDGSTLAGSQSLMQVSATPLLDVRGTVTVSPATVMVNQPVTLAAEVVATAAVSGLPVTLAVVDPATSTVLQQWTDNITGLAAGASYQMPPQVWKALGKGGDNLLAVLSAGADGKYVNLARQPLSLTPSLAQRVAGSLSLSSATPMLGSSLTVSGNIANQGDADLGNLEISLTIIDPVRPESPLFSQNATGLTLAKGASSQGEANWVVVGAAGVKLSAIYQVKLNGDVVELARQDFVPLAAFADSVTGSLSLSNVSPLPGETLTLSGGIQNIGVSRLAGIATQFSIVDPLAPDTPLFSQSATFDLDGGASGVSSAAWTVAGALGARLSAVFSATFNGQSVTLGKQDFVLLQKLAERIKGSVTLSSTTPLSGDPLSISANVVNQGIAAIPGLVVRVLIVDPKAPDVVIYSRNATLDLGGSQTQVVNGEWNVSAPAGSQLEARVVAALGAESVLLGSQAFSVKNKAVVSAAQELGSRVLVYFSCRPDWDDHDRYKYWERKAPCFGERRRFIGNLLESLGLPYTIVDDEEEFAAAFRSHRYNTYWLLGAYTHFTGKLVDELNESVFRGDALILDSGLHAWRNWDLLETAGVRYRGRLYCVKQEISTLGKLFSPVNLSTEGWPLMLETGKGVVEAQYQAGHVRDVEDDDDDHQGERGEYGNQTSKPKTAIFPAIVSNVYGMGRTLLFNFDLLDTLMDTNDANWGTLARDAFAYLKPQDASVSMLGGGVPLDIRLSSKGEDATIKAQLALPQGASLLDSKPPAGLEGGKPTWNLTVGKSAVQMIQTLIGSPTQPGEVHVTTQVSNAGGDIATLESVYTVLDANRAGTQAIAAVNSLNVSKNEKSYRDKALKNLGDAQSDVNRRRFEQAIRELTEAAEFLVRIDSADHAAARRAIDIWLRDIEIAALEADKPNKPPVVFPPKNECKIRAGIIGKDNDRSLEIEFEPKPDDSGKNGDTFVAAALELDGVPRWFFLTEKGWSLWQGGVVPKQGAGKLGAKTLRVLDRLDMSGFLGASIYVGYRVGAAEIKLYPAFTVR